MNYTQSEFIKKFNYNNKQKKNTHSIQMYNNQLISLITIVEYVYIYELGKNNCK